MSRTNFLKHQFVENIPEHLQDATLYVSVRYSTAVHRCCCSCATEVVTPISPTGWRITFDGVSVSLYPSIGNWSLPCQSHYWIRRGKVIWARKWSPKEIAKARLRDQEDLRNYHSGDE